MGLFGFGKKNDTNLVVVIFEGPSRLRLNGNRKHGKAAESAKKNATSHEGTVCWMEFSQGGSRIDQGTGPSAGKLGPGEVDRLLRELPFNAECKAMLLELEQGKERAAKILRWDSKSQPARHA